MFPEHIGRYQILQSLGEGGMGVVYRAYDPDLNRQVALKALKPPDPSRSDEWRRRFRREVQAAAGLKHPHIVQVYDVSLDHDPPYVVMQFLSGGTLRQGLKDRSLTWQQAVRLLLPMCEALDYAHKHGLVHRDVKPANMMFAGDETQSLSPNEWRKDLMLVDFGLARRMEDQKITQSGGVLGTPLYMAPEQADGEEVDASADIFALGLILFEAIAGYNPQDKGSTGQNWIAITSKEPIDLTPLRKVNAPPQLVQVIGKVLEKDKAKRYNNCETLRIDLERCLTQAGDASPYPFSSDEGVVSGPLIENPKNLDLPSCAEDILKIMFPTHARVAILQELGGGLSGGRVLVVQPIKTVHEPELLTVVKMASVSLIQKEWRAYQAYIHERLPKIAEIRGEPVLPPGCDWGGLRYHLLGGGGTFEIKSLLDYCRDASVEDARAVTERLLKIMDQIWQHTQTHPAFHWRKSYDPILPVNLLIQPMSVPPGATLYLIKADDLHNLPELHAGDYVRLEGFAVTKVDLVQNTVTLNLPSPSGGSDVSYCLRLKSVQTMAAFQINATIRPTEGRILETREERLQTAVKETLGKEFHYTSEVITLPNGTRLPNPLTRWQAILDGVYHVKETCIHGDLNLENILVEPETGGVSLIDFSEARKDHILHDLLRLETEIVTKLIPPILVKTGLPPGTICDFYELVHCAVVQRRGFWPLVLCYAVRRNPFKVPFIIIKMAALQKPFVMLEIIRQKARGYFFAPDDWSQYYGGLTIYLLGALKFRNLDEASEFPLSKQTAFLAAAAAQKLNNKSFFCRKSWLCWVLPLAIVAILAGMAWLGFAKLLMEPASPTVKTDTSVIETTEQTTRMDVIATTPTHTKTPANIPTNNSEPPIEEQQALIIHHESEVEVKRVGTNLLIPVEFGMRLYQGDVVITYKKASVIIVCQNGQIFQMSSERNITVSCQETPDAEKISQLPQELSVVLVNASAVSTPTLSSDTRRSRDQKGPLLLSPRNTVITDTMPTFLWQPVKGTNGYRLSIKMSNNESWDKETSANSLLYPGDVSPLMPDSTNFVTLVLLDNEAMKDLSTLKVLDKAGQTVLAKAEAEIWNLNLDDSAKQYLLVQLYQQWGLLSAAINQLEQLIAVQATPSAYLLQQLGDLYFAVELYDRAEENYRAALEAAQASNDPTAQAAAHVGLAQVIHLYDEKNEQVVLDHLTAAETLYRQAGESGLADQVAAERSKMKK